MTIEEPTVPLQLVWVQNLIGFLQGTFPADEKWKAVFVERLTALPAKTVVEWVAEWKAMPKPDLHQLAISALSELEELERYGNATSQAIRPAIASIMAENSRLELAALSAGTETPGGEK